MEHNISTWLSVHGFVYNNITDRYDLDEYPFKLSVAHNFNFVKIFYGKDSIHTIVYINKTTNQIIKHLLAAYYTFTQQRLLPKLPSNIVVGSKIAFKGVNAVYEVTEIQPRVLYAKVISDDLVTNNLHVQWKLTYELICLIQLKD